MSRILREFAGVLLLLLACATAASAQLSTAQLDGRVTDESGAVLPGVTVTVTQTDTGFTRTAVTDGDGSYLLPNLPTGPYRFEVSLQGFRSYTQTGIVLQVGGTPTINVALAIGTLEESVTVEAASPLVDVRSAGISEVVENERILELPLQGREVTSLLVLAGASIQQGVNVMRTVNGGARIAVAGGLSYGVTYVLDGAMHTNPQDNLNLPLPFPDALQEFSVATSGLTAQNGVHSGASVNAVTKSGTNRFSGSAFEFFRDKRFNATDPFAPIGEDGERQDDGLSRHQFGGTLGGPILRDRLFFFGAYQGTRLRAIPASNIAWVPTRGDAVGRLHAVRLAGVQQRTAGQPARPVRQQSGRSRAVQPGGDERATACLPTTTDPCGEVTYGVPNDTDEWQAVSKVDYQWTPNHTVFGRYLHTFVEELPVWVPGDPDSSILATREMGKDRTAVAKSFTLGDTVVLGSNMVNSLRWRTTRPRSSPCGRHGSTRRRSGSTPTRRFPARCSEHHRGRSTSATPAASTQTSRNQMYQVGDDFTLVRGSHQFTVGANVAYWNSHQELNARSPGTYSFNGNATGLGLADFLTGQLFRLEQSDPQILEMNQTYIGLFAQDSWRATNRVTVNAGFRWEPYLGQNVTNVAIPNFSIDRFRSGTKSTVYMNAPAGLLFPGDAGFPSGRSGLNKQWGNVSPRLGVAWDVTGDGRTAVRSSYAITYDFPPGDYQYRRTRAPRRLPTASRVQGVSFDDPYATYPGGNPFPFPSPPPSTAEFPVFGAFGDDRPGHQLAPRPELERDAWSSSWGRMGRVRQLSG